MGKKQTINKKFVKEYFHKWVDYNQPTDSDFILFINMLQNKAYNAKIDNRTYFCFDDQYGAEDIEKMLIIAEDNKSYIMK